MKRTSAVSLVTVEEPNEVVTATPLLPHRYDFLGFARDVQVHSRFLHSEEDNTKRTMEKILDAVRRLPILCCRLALPGSDRASLLDIAEHLQAQLVKLADADPLMKPYTDRVTKPLTLLLNALAVSDANYAKGLDEPTEALSVNGAALTAMETLDDFGPLVRDCGSVPEHTADPRPAILAKVAGLRNLLQSHVQSPLASLQWAVIEAEGIKATIHAVASNGSVLNYPIDALTRRCDKLIAELQGGVLPPVRALIPTNNPRQALSITKPFGSWGWAQDALA